MWAPLRKFFAPPCVPSWLRLWPRSLQPFHVLTSLRHHKGDTKESDRKLLCLEIDCASATRVESSVQEICKQKLRREMIEKD